jgi:hypothetical protein
MADDDYATDWHLTPRGWVQGTDVYFGRPTAESPPPEDRVLTMRDRVYQRSNWSREEKSWTQIWRSPVISDSEIAALRARYADPR